MKYLVYMNRALFQNQQQIDVVEADKFKMKEDHIIFKKGFRMVAFFRADCVEKILKEGEEK